MTPSTLRAPELTVWAALGARLPRLGAYAGPSEVPPDVVIGELKALGIGPTDHLLLPQMCCYSFTWVRQHVEVICNLKVGDGRFDWVQGSGASRQEALCLAAMMALDWKDKHDAGP